MLEIARSSPIPGPVVKYRIKLTQTLGTEPIYHWLTNKIEVMIFRDGNRVRVVTSLCPHMGARLQWDRTRSRVKCPWHGLSYDGNGLKSCHHRYRQLTEFQAELVDDELLVYE
jgi:nitrite reductase/ring-hydroxylating ferredoxin subunit